jgi:opacity protein-like surface antigen
VLLSLVALIVATPDPARAEGLLTGFLGSSFAGDSDTGQTTYGVSLATTAGGLFGVEVDVGTTRDIFGHPETVGESSVTTAMGNVVVGAPLGFLRPYAVGGVGLIRSSVDGPANSIELDRNDFGVNFGAGLIGFFTDHVGLRGDVRWFRTTSGDGDDRLLEFDLDLDDVDFWRGSLGVTLRW